MPRKPKSSPSSGESLPPGSLIRSREVHPVVYATGILDGLDDLRSVVRAEADALEDQLAVSLAGTPGLALGRVRVRMSVEWEPWQAAGQTHSASSAREYLVIGHADQPTESAKG